MNVLRSFKLPGAELGGARCGMNGPPFILLTATTGLDKAMIHRDRYFEKDGMGSETG